MFVVAFFTWIFTKDSDLLEICVVAWTILYRYASLNFPLPLTGNTYSNYKLWEYYRWWSPILASSFVAIRITNRRRSTQRLGQMGCFFFAGRVKGEPLLGMNRVTTPIYRWPYKWVTGGITPTSGVTGPYLQLFFSDPPCTIDGEERSPRNCRSNWNSYSPVN